MRDLVYIASTPQSARVRGAAHRAGFTLIELLVVVAIIAILISAVLVASSTLVNAAKEKSTQVILTIVRDAVDQFSAEQTRTPTLANARQGAATYRNRFGTFPPDSIEVFTTKGLPTATGMPGSLGVNRAQLVPGPGTSGVKLGQMMFYHQTLTPQQLALEFRDQVAMQAAIEMFSEAGSSILSRIPDRNRSPGVLTPPPQSTPVLFLDRPPTLNGMWNSAEDWQIRHILDDWGNPIGYMSTRDWTPSNTNYVDSTNMMGWGQTSTQLIKLNGDRPVIFSYGANGDDQLTPEVMGGTAAASIPVDWAGGAADQRMTDPLNADNVYANSELAEKVKKGS